MIFCRNLAVFWPQAKPNIKKKILKFFPKKIYDFGPKIGRKRPKTWPEKPAGLSGGLGQPKNRPGGRAKPENQNITNFFLRLKNSSLYHNPIVVLSYIVTILS